MTPYIIPVLCAALGLLAIAGGVWWRWLNDPRRRRQADLEDAFATWEADPVPHHRRSPLEHERDTRTEG